MFRCFLWMMLGFVLGCSGSGSVDVVPVADPVPVYVEPAVVVPAAPPPTTVVVYP